MRGWILTRSATPSIALLHRQKAPFPFQIPSFHRTLRARSWLGGKEYRAGSMRSGVALRVRIQRGRSCPPAIECGAQSPALTRGRIPVSAKTPRTATYMQLGPGRLLGICSNELIWLKFLFLMSSPSVPVGERSIPSAARKPGEGATPQIAVPLTRPASRFARCSPTSPPWGEVRIERNRP